MASAMLSCTTVAPVKVQTTIVASLGSLKSNSAFPISRKSAKVSKGFKVNCMKVWPPINMKKYETLSYLPQLSDAELGKEVDYLLRQGWIPCLEFETEHGFVYREHHHSPGYYDGRYWTMWKLPMFGCTDSSQVLKELEECKKEYPQAFIRIIGFDNKRQVQCISFIAYKPKGF